METKEQLDKMPEVTNDETGELVAENLRDILVTDIEKYEKHLIQLKKDKENYERQLAVDMEMWDILKQPGAFKKIESAMQFEHEKNPRYWELVQSKQLEKIRQEEARALGTLEQMDFEKKTIEEDLADKKEKLEKLEGDKNE